MEMRPLRPGQDAPEGVDFLTALLVRHREIGSASLSGHENRLGLNFYLQRRASEEEWDTFQELVKLSWAAFFRLQRSQPQRADFIRGENGKGEPPFEHESPDDLEVESLSLVRDLSTVSTEEISMLVTLVREHFRSDLASNEETVNQDEEQQEEMLYRTLERLRGVDSGGILTGFRDDMRVLIYASLDN